MSAVYDWKNRWKEQKARAEAAEVRARELENALDYAQLLAAERDKQRARADALAAEVERLTADNAAQQALLDAAMLEEHRLVDENTTWQEAVTELEAERAALRAQLAAGEVDDYLYNDMKNQRDELFHAHQRIEAERNALAAEVERLTAEVAALRAQLVAREHAACPHCGQSLHGERLLPF